MVYYCIWNYNCDLWWSIDNAIQHQSGTGNNCFFVTKCNWYDALRSNLVGIASIIGYLPDSFYYIIFGKWMDKFGNNAYPMIFGFLMGTAALGMVITILMRKLIKKNNKKEGI